MHLHIAADHAGYELKQQLIDFLQQQGHTVTDYGTHSTDSMDYPDVVHALVQGLKPALPEGRGILLCGSGEGVCMTANKYADIRAALVWTPEIAALTRQHNDANILCLPARFISTSDAQVAVTTFLSTAFEGGRHTRRVEKMQPH